MTVATGVRLRQCRHRKLPLARHDRWSYELVVLCSMYQRNRVHDRVAAHDEVLLMALTFGTLLSSQGADAHHLGPFGPLPGQPTKPYSVGFARSNLTGTARFPLGLRARTAAPLELGGCPVGSAVMLDAAPLRRTPPRLARCRMHLNRAACVTTTHGRPPRITLCCKGKVSAPDRP
jgi:hypothetical protein